MASAQPMLCDLVANDDWFRLHLRSLTLSVGQYLLHCDSLGQATRGAAMRAANSITREPWAGDPALPQRSGEALAAIIETA